MDVFEPLVLYGHPDQESKLITMLLQFSQWSKFESLQYKRMKHIMSYLIFIEWKFVAFFNVFISLVWLLSPFYFMYLFVGSILFYFLSFCITSVYVPVIIFFWNTGTGPWWVMITHVKQQQKCKWSNILRIISQVSERCN